jgi:ssDNA-binding Zn-finger/Zn-ribbon topoisomerase 1
MKQEKFSFEKEFENGCTYCHSKFEEDDFAFLLETGKCPYCHHLLLEKFSEDYLLYLKKEK